MPEKAIVTVPSTIRVSRTVKIGKTGDEASSSDVEEEIEVHQFVTTPAMARIMIPLKKAHNYNSAGLTVGVDMPCYKEELPQALEKAYEIAKERLLTELPKIIEALKKL
jgi:hypothetical protein